MILDELKELRDRVTTSRDIYEFELSGMPEGRLLRSSGKGADRYYVGYKENGEYVRKGVKKQPELVRSLARKEYLRKVLPAIEHNIEVLDTAIKKYAPCDVDSIVDGLSATYKSLPREDFMKSEVDVVALNIDMEDAKRIASHREWAEQEYTASDYLPEGRQIITSKGERMRSKAEVMIAEKLYEYGIPFRYEQELLIDGFTMHPDFTFEGMGGEPFYLEFCGMMDSPEYVESFKRKRTLYESAGIYEWGSMIYIFETGNSMNMAEIDSVIRNKVLPKL